MVNRTGKGSENGRKRALVYNKLGHTQTTELTRGECCNAVTREQDDQAHEGGGTQGEMSQTQVCNSQRLGH